MLCTSCWRTARPDVRIGGSDRVELVAWALFLLPGLLYCAWRYVNRSRICAACGSGALVRQARAAQRRDPALLSWGGGRLVAADQLGWPRLLSTPTARMVHGGVGALLFGLLLLERTLAGLAGAAWASSPWLPALACALWLSWQGARLLQLRARNDGLAAYDESGRALHVEALL
jgi:hypothetical protein